MNIFTNQKINFEPNLNIATPKNYILGAGDELEIDISGYAYAHYACTINADGNIKIENLTPIYLNGVSIDQAKAKITQKLRSIFGGLGSGGLSVDVTLSKIRSIKVNVIGEAVYPGSYTIPSLATAFNVLYAAGGPTSLGSLRNIEIMRNGRLLRKLDIYDFLFKGDLNDNVILHDQDVIRIPYSDINVSILGEIKNPKIFELKKSESLQNLLEYSGGYSDRAYQKIIKVERIGELSKKIESVEKGYFASFHPQRGDIYVVDSVSNKFENIVTIKGSIMRAGDYEIEEANTVKKLVTKAQGVKKDAFVERVLIKRERLNLDPEIIQINLNDILNGSAPDVALHQRDSVLINSMADLRTKRTVLVNGEVKNGKNLDFAENMTVGDAIMLAGGFTEGGSANKIEISRRISNDSLNSTANATIDIIQLSINRDFKMTDKESKIILQPYDKIYVRKMANYEDQKVANVTGEVYFPGPYSMIDKKEKISDLIKKSGGMRPEADIRSAKFMRNKKQIGIDLISILNDQNNYNNLFLLPGDSLIIPRKSETVSITGNVYNPMAVVPYDKSKGTREYISMAGGMSDSAFVSKIYVKYSNGQMRQTNSFLGFKIFPKIEPGTEIIVPTKHKGKWSSAERISAYSAMVSITTILVTVIRLLTNGG